MGPSVWKKMKAQVAVQPLMVAGVEEDHGNNT